MRNNQENPVVQDLVWSGVVRLTRPALVPAGESLTIKGGTRIVISADVGEPALTVHGELRVEGGAGGRAIFFPEGEPPVILRVAGAGRAALEGAEFLHGATGLLCEDEAAVSVRDSSFWELASNGAVAAGRARASFEKTLFTRCATGATALDEARLSLDACRFSGSPQCGVNGMGLADVLARGCAFESNHTAVSVCAQARADARENDFRANLVGAHAKGRSRLNLFRNRFHGRPALDVDVLEDATISAVREPAWEVRR